MRIRSVVIKGFRCFDGEGQRIVLNDFTCLVGPNASGKTACMLSLVRMFGDTQTERTIRAGDFHLRNGEDLSAIEERKLSLEAVIDFPEVDDAEADDSSIPEAFNQMVVADANGAPYCRIRLDATWTRDGTAQGEVKQELYWIVTPSEDPAVIEQGKRTVKTAERARIRVVYVPAARDPNAQIRATSATVFGRLLRAIDWGAHKDVIEKQLKDLRDQVRALPGLNTMNSKVQGAWGNLYEGRVAANVTFQSEQSDTSALLGMLVPTFAPNEQGQSFQAGELSDGLRSLFALSLPLGFHRIEAQLKQDAGAAGFKPEVVETFPFLTVFGVEEPENHLAPHYLGRVVNELFKTASESGAQVVLSSHSPSIMRRVSPDDVRYFLGGEARASTEIMSLDLPENESDEAFKYVREAVRGHPELYFSRLVVLAEGPSEEIVLRAAFEASGNPLDAIFVSVVPLGGRHVNHFWRLLHSLKIPYVTLLDLDREKDGAGWGRLQYVRDELVSLHGEKSTRLLYEDASKAQRSLAAADNTVLGGAAWDAANMLPWINYYQKSFDVFFSQPLDLDFSMLKQFPDAYKAQAPLGPRLPKADPQLSEAYVERMVHVLAPDPKNPAPDLGKSYDKASEVPLFAWYKYLFLDNSKPVAHMRAMISLSSTAWVEKMPAELKALVERVKTLTGPQVPEPPKPPQSGDGVADADIFA